MKKLLCAVFYVALIITVKAQDIKKIKATDVLTMMDTTATPLIINFWATWCKPCVSELKYFEKVVSSFKDKKIALVLISLDFADDYEALQNFVKTKGYACTVYWLNEPNLAIIQEKIDSRFEGSIPATLFINKKKNYKNFHDGQISQSSLKKEITTLVE